MVSSPSLRLVLPHEALRVSIYFSYFDRKIRGTFYLVLSYSLLCIGMAATSCRLSSQLHHIVLPPLLPGQREKNLTEIENSLNDRLVEAAKVIRNFASPESYQLWDAVRRTLLVSKSICLAGAVNSHRLIDEFGLLPSGTTLILHIAEQNAGLLIRRNNE